MQGDAVLLLATRANEEGRLGIWSRSVFDTEYLTSEVSSGWILYHCLHMLIVNKTKEQKGKKNNSRTPDRDRQLAEKQLYEMYGVHELRTPCVYILRVLRNLTYLDLRFRRILSNKEMSRPDIAGLCHQPPFPLSFLSLQIMIRKMHAPSHHLERCQTGDSAHKGMPVFN